MDRVLETPSADRLRVLARELAAGYRSARPFPHAVVDEFLPEATANALLDEFPEPGSIEWGASYADERQLKLACEDTTLMGSATRQLILYLNSGEVLQFLEQLTGIHGLLPDPYLKGGGLHQSKPGGFLKVHADFNWYERLGLHRRLNLLLYLNPDWEEEYGGHLELWNREMTACEQRILPVLNRCVVFSTTDDSFHGHPDPLRCPPDRTRKSIALYYYTSERPAEERSAPHTTVFVDRPEGAGGGAADPGQVAAAIRRERLRVQTRRFVPPILWDGLAAVKKRRARG